MPFAARFSCCAPIDFKSILKYFPRGLSKQSLYQNLWKLSNYWSVKQSRGLFLFERNEMKNRKGTLTPKMPFAARFSCCATIDFNSILNTFRGGYHNKFYNKIFGNYLTIDLWKNRGGYFCSNEMIRKSQRHSNTKNAFRCQILVLRDYRFQFNIKILSEWVIITNFISKSLGIYLTIDLWKNRGGYFWLHEMR